MGGARFYQQYYPVLKKDFGGSKNDKNTGLNTKVLTGLDTVADLSEESEVGVVYQIFGRKE